MEEYISQNNCLLGVLLDKKNNIENFLDPSHLSKGYMILVSTQKKFWSYQGLKNKEIKPNMYWLGLVKNKGRFQLQGDDSLPHLSYSVIYSIEVVFLEKKLPPDRIYVWKLANSITKMREYEAVVHAIRSSGSVNNILNTLLNGQHTFNVNISKSSMLLNNDCVGKSKKISHPNLNPLNPRLSVNIQKWLRNHFNPSQEKAIIEISKCSDGFSLIQGPPGSGKTHTLIGLLNVLHLSIFQEFHSSIARYLDPSLDPLAKVPQWIDQSFFEKKVIPHFLVTTPSNSSLNSIISKLLIQKFRDNNDNLYLPNIVCLGKGMNMQESSIKDTSHVYIDNQVNNILKQNYIGKPILMKQRIKELEKKKSLIEVDMKSTHNEIKQHAVMFKSHRKKVKNNIIKKQSNDSQNISDESSKNLFNNNSSVKKQIRVDESQADLINLNNSSSNISNNLEKEFLKKIHSLIACYLQQRDMLMRTIVEIEQCRIIYSNKSERVMIAQLRTSILENAHIIFTTLSSSGLQEITSFGKHIKFEVLVVDEAAQATEPSTMVPMRYNSRHCILIGDPKQLPATVISKSAVTHNLQQSLFERLQSAGHPVFMLNQQYRSHPLISSFSQKYFYGNVLKNAENVLSTDYNEHYTIQGYGPLNFLNLTSSIEGKLNLSYINEGEAKLVLNLYITLRNFLHVKVNGKSVNDQSSARNKVGIGIITPYREQLALIIKIFSEKKIFKDRYLELNTIDGYQGLEFDIIIISCVRANDHDNKNVKIGFLNDERRLNVAITRAKYMLFIIGQKNVLCLSKLWKNFFDSHTDDWSIQEYQQSQ